MQNTQDYKTVFKLTGIFTQITEQLLKKKKGRRNLSAYIKTITSVFQTISLVIKLQYNLY